MLLLDEDLIGLPLESIHALCSMPTIKSIARDFSLQLLVHRIGAQGEAGEAGAQGGAKTKPAASKAKGKVVDEAVTIAVESSTVSYILDPRADVKGRL